MASSILLPGDTIPPSALPHAKNPSKPLTLGPGLRHTPPLTITAHLAGPLHTDSKKNAIWVENNGGRYIPHPSDLIIATILSSHPESYTCSLSPYTPPTLLPHLSFESATKKTRPILLPGSLVYARIASTPSSTHLTSSSSSSSPETELECIHPSTGKADGLGPLKGGMVWDISLGFARELLKKGDGVAGIEGVKRFIGEGRGFECAVGRNGRVWVDAGSVGDTVRVGREIVEADGRRRGSEWGRGEMGFR
ncbi:hypothetical protein M501DRAFT_1024154 [Patellaria atrata CBS 101060]|uniref:K Homology domain-containing protein n=1 Tax=Patellaria atrata CBS 101060 TaxID=1346257 RepID=A0A9P4VT16_9PEZI|nr:hypothetical protein M501DRAFT_1024154 [Patellaria atrata CBS 101060]